MTICQHTRAPMQYKATPQNDSTLIIYESPLNEAMRLCLRLESLFQQFDSAIADSHASQKNAMIALLRIWETTDRPDLKSKLGQTISQYTITLNQLSKQPLIDHDKLSHTLDTLEQLNQQLHNSYTRLDETLRRNEFLYNLRFNLSNPGGLAPDKTPALNLWLRKYPQEQINDLCQWIKPFDNLRALSTTLLQVTRDSTPLNQTKAESGFYHQTLDTSGNFQLIRIALPVTQNLYPEFGHGKHRLTIRFVTPEYFGKGRPKQTDQSFHFLLSCCKI